MEQLGSHWTDFHEIWYLRIFRKSVKKIQFSLKSDENNGYFTRIPTHILILSHSVFLRMRNVSDKVCRENQNTHFVFSKFLFRKSCRLWDNEEKYCTAGQATDGRVAHAHCMQDTSGYKHTFIICYMFALPLQHRLHERASVLRCT